jgi:hypothetical protein
MSDYDLPPEEYDNFINCYEDWLYHSGDSWPGQAQLDEPPPVDELIPAPF